MHWISLLFQFINLRKNLDESKAILEAAKAIAEKAKRYLITFVGLIFAVFFLITSLVLAIIEIGLQIDSQSFLHFSGLMISSTILAGIGICVLLISLLLGQATNAVLPQEKHHPKEDQIKELLEEFIITFLTKLSSTETRNIPKEGPR